MLAETNPGKFLIVFSVASTSMSTNLCWFSGSTVKTFTSVTTSLSFEIVVIRFPFQSRCFDTQAAIISRLLPSVNLSVSKHFLGISNTLLGHYPFAKVVVQFGKVARASPL